MELICHDTERRVALREGEEVIVGRRREWRIEDRDVSRVHARFRRKEKNRVELQNEAKHIYIRRKGGKKYLEKLPNSCHRVVCGDRVFLLRRENVHLYGFELRRRDPSPTKAEKRRVLNFGMFAGDKLMFLAKSHVGLLRERVAECGAEVVDELVEGVDYAVVSEETAHLFRDLYGRRPETKFVKREFLSESLAAGKKLDPEPYLLYRPVTSVPGQKTGMESAPAEGTATPPSLESRRVALPESYDWVEAHDEEKARQTVQRLLRHWTHYSGPAPQLSEDEESRSDVEWTSERVHPLCQHPACSGLEVCFVQELNVLKQHYHGRRADTFRIKAANTAIRVLEGLTSPIRSVEDVQKLGLGQKTTEKLIQVLETGHIRRNVEMADDATEQLFQQFSAVWGARQTTAQKWISAGCTSLEQVRRRSDLTEIQKTGIKYYADFRQKIPRAEAQSLFERVQKCVISVVARLTHTTIRRCQSQVFCAALGSFVRGKEQMGDIDFMICPPVTSNIDCSDLLLEILNELRRREFITTDLLPAKLKLGGERPASWMGVCFSPLSALHRRIDIKVYPRPFLPFALNYFIGSQDFVRALRYWCNRPPSEEIAALASQHVPGANAFKLTDDALHVCVREGPRAPLHLTGRDIPCESETDVFRAVGLDYVPPWMRVFN